MRRPRHEIEAQVPLRVPKKTSKPNEPGSLPQIRRQIERICESLGVEYDDLAELHLYEGQAIAITFARDEAGELYRDEFGKLAQRQTRIPIDTVTFIGDERDI